MNRTPAHTDTPISERDAAWFEELAEAVDRGRAGMISRPTSGGDGYWLRLLVAPVNDTALSLISLVDAGQPGDSYECEAAVRRLLKDSRSLNTNDTAMTLISLWRSRQAIRTVCGEVVHDGINRLMEVQNRDGGWTAVVGDAKPRSELPG